MKIKAQVSSIWAKGVYLDDCVCVISLFSLFLPSMGWLCDVRAFGLIEYSHSLPALHF